MNRSIPYYTTPTNPKWFSMTNQSLSKLHKFIAPALLTVFFLSEAYGKYLIWYFRDKSDVAKWIKLAIMAAAFSLCLKYWKSLKIFLVLTVIFFLGQWTITNGFQQEIIVSFGKFLFPLVLFLYFNKNPLNSEGYKWLFKAFEILILVNSLLIVIGFLFEVPLFKTYRYDNRFGYDGLMIVSATATYVYSIACFYFLVRLKDKFLTHWKSLFFILSLLLLGTKSAYLCLFVSLIVYVVFYLKISKTAKIILLIAGSLLAMVVFYIFFFQWGLFNEIRQAEGFLTSLLSTRDKAFMEVTWPFIQQEWSWLNYFVGGINDLSTRSQMGVVDVFFIWGIVGGIIYLYSYYKSFVIFKTNKVVSILMVTLFVLIFLSGNFFENASIAIYMLVLQGVFSQEDQLKQEYDAH